MGSLSLILSDFTFTFFQGYSAVLCGLLNAVTSLLEAVTSWAQSLWSRALGTAQVIEGTLA